MSYSDSHIKELDSGIRLSHYLSVASSSPLPSLSLLCLSHPLCRSAGDGRRAAGTSKCGVPAGDGGRQRVRRRRIRGRGVVIGDGPVRHHRPHPAGEGGGVWWLWRWSCGRSKQQRAAASRALASSAPYGPAQRRPHAEALHPLQAPTQPPP